MSRTLLSLILFSFLRFPVSYQLNLAKTLSSVSCLGSILTLHLLTHLLQKPLLLILLADLLYLEVALWTLHILYLIPSISTHRLILFIRAFRHHSTRLPTNLASL